MRLALLVLVLAGCAKQPPPDVMPVDVRTEEGARQLQMDLARALVDSGNGPAAMQLIAKLNAAGKPTPELTLLQARALYLTGLTTEAERLLSGVAETQPKNPEPLRILGVIYTETNRLDDAARVLVRATELTPGDGAVWNNLGFVRLGLEDFAGAEAALRRAVELDGTQPRYRNNLGFALAANGRLDEALETFISAGGPADAHHNLGLACEMRGDELDAVVHYQAALRYNPGHDGARDALDRLLQTSGEVDDAP